MLYAWVYDVIDLREDIALAIAFLISIIMIFVFGASILTALLDLATIIRRLLPV